MIELELARTKLAVYHLAKHTDLPDAENLLKALREAVAFLERRVAREKVNLAKESIKAVDCASLTI